MSELLQIVVSGVLLGGLLALYAAGLSLVFGVMRIVNLAHGDLIVLAAYLGLFAVQASGLGPGWWLVPMAAVMFVLGWLYHRFVLHRTLGGGLMPPLLVGFGLSIVLQNALLEVFSADTRRIRAGGLETASLSLGPVTVGLYPLLVFLAAVALLGGLELYFGRTATGRRLRATADDPVTVRLVGISPRTVYALAMGLSFAVSGVAGVLMGIWTNFAPSDGPIRLLWAFETVIIGGLGSLWGTLVGGIVLGVAMSVGGRIDPGLQMLFGHFAFVLALALRPQGLFAPRREGAR